MAVRIQKPAPGLYGALGVVGERASPAELAQFVQPTYALEDFYLAQENQIRTVALTGAQTVGDNINLEVPSNEYWRVFGMGATCSSFSGAGDVVDVSLSVGRGNSQLPLATNQQTIAAATNIIRFGLQTPRLILAPGQSAQLTLNRTIVATFNLTMRLLVAQLPAGG